MNRTEIRKIQDRLLEMGKGITAILEKYDIPYMISFGTLLGAVRHKGFIPWDDDFDLWLFEEDYEKAITLLRNELADDMIVEDDTNEELFFHAWAHVKDINSEAMSEQFPHDNLYAHKGISVDLYKLHKCKLSEVQDYLREQNILYIQKRLQKGLITKKEYEQRLMSAPKDYSINLLEESDREVYAMINAYKHKHLEEKEIFPLKKYEFEDYFFWGPSDAHKILSDLYGTYMELPPVNKRHNHYSSIKWLNK